MVDTRTQSFCCPNAGDQAQPSNDLRSSRTVLVKVTNYLIRAFGKYCFFVPRWSALSQFFQYLPGRP